MIELTITNIIDLVLAALVCGVLPFIVYRKTGFKIFAVYLAFAVAYLAVLFCDTFFGLPMLKSVATIAALMALTMFLLVYLNDIRSMFFHWSSLGQSLKKEDIKASDEELRVAIDEIVRACTAMSKVRSGALLVIAPGNISSHLLETGTELGALVTAPLLESIFITKGPMHDGAVIIKGNKALAAGCFLPLSQVNSLNKSLGTRHRAGIGITEQTDMLTIIVSEENGIISVAEKGELKRYITPERLSDILGELYKIGATARRKTITK